LSSYNEKWEEKELEKCGLERIQNDYERRNYLIHINLIRRSKMIGQDKSPPNKNS
jgi:hypothetical protein